MPQLLALARGDRPGPIYDEDRFLESALEHRMLGVVSAAHRRGSLALSIETGTTIGMLDLKERHRHKLFWEAIGEVQHRLAEVGARVAVLKGVATEARWYDEIGERVCTDVDLLLCPHDLPLVAAVVESLDPDRGAVDHIHRAANARILQHVDLRLGDIQVDLHFDPFKIGLPSRRLFPVWDSTEPLVSQLGTITVLDAESELLLMLLHLNKDSFSMLGPLLDVRRIAEHGAIDWDRLAAAVAAEGLEVPVWSSLATVVDTLGMDLEVPSIAGIRARTWKRIWRHTLGGYEGRDRAPRVQRLMGLHARRRTNDQLREIRRQLLPQRALLEVAGRLRPGQPYLGYLVGRLGKGLASVGTGSSLTSSPSPGRSPTSWEEHGR